MPGRSRKTASKARAEEGRLVGWIRCAQQCLDYPRIDGQVRAAGKRVPGLGARTRVVRDYPIQEQQSVLAAPHAPRGILVRTVYRILTVLAVPITFAAMAGTASPAELQSPRMISRTVMTREMETLRRELNAVAAQAQGIKDAANADERRILLREHLVRLREATASLRMMESRMHDALERGQIAVDHTARERHMFMFDQFSTMMTLMESALVDAQAPMVGCGSSEVAPKNGR